MPCKHALEVTTEQLEWMAGWAYRTPNGHPLIDIATEARKVLDSIPKTISINGHDVPEPMREKPEYGTTYWAISPGNDEGVCDYEWRNDGHDLNFLNSGSCHLTRDNCIAHAKALFSFSEVG